MNIGTAIRVLRKRAKINQALYSKNIGISQCYLSQIENGHKTPSLDVLKDVANGFGVPLAIIFWFGVEESDIPLEKREIFKLIKPSLDNLLEGLIG